MICFNLLSLFFSTCSYFFCSLYLHYLASCPDLICWCSSSKYQFIPYIGTEQWGFFAFALNSILPILKMNFGHFALRSFQDSNCPSFSQILSPCNLTSFSFLSQLISNLLGCLECVTWFFGEFCLSQICLFGFFQIIFLENLLAVFLCYSWCLLTP